MIIDNERGEKVKKMKRKMQS